MQFARVALSIAPGRSPRARPAPSRASGSLRATPPTRHAPGSPGSWRARLRERCVSPTSATDSHHEHLHAARLPTAWQKPDADQGGAPLDGGPPASAPPRPAFDAARTEVLTPPPLRAIALLVDPRSRDPARHATRPQPCRPRVELPARPLTPTVVPAPSHSAFRSSRRRRPPGTASAATSSKVPTASEPGRLPSTSALSSAVVRRGSRRVHEASRSSRRSSSPLHPPELAPRSPARFPTREVPRLGTAGSSRARHRTRSLDAARRLRTPPSPRRRSSAGAEVGGRC